MKKLKLYLMVSILFILCSSLYSQTKNILKVDVDSPNGEWGASAYKHLQDALADAQEGDEIWVAEGTYFPDDYESTTPPNLTDPREASFNLINGVSLYGGFEGNELTLEDRPPILLETILSGDIGNENDDSDNSYHVLTCDQISTLSVIDGCIIIQGNANNGSSPHHIGGGLYIKNSNFEINNCKFVNYFSWYGGAIGISGKNVDISIKNTYFFKNIGHRGSAISSLVHYTYINSQIIINQCNFNENESIGEGGAIYAPIANIKNSTFTLNKATENGGAIKHFNEIENCIFNQNEALNGGAIVGSGKIINCIFSSNVASNRGGAIFASYEAVGRETDLIIKNSKFSANEANFGGAVCTFNGEPVKSSQKSKNKRFSNLFHECFLINNTFYNNEAYQDGGALYHLNIDNNYNSYLNHYIINSTFNSNKAQHGKSISSNINLNVNLFSFEITNSIFWGADLNQIHSSQGNNDIKVSYSCVKGGYTNGQNIITSDPLLTADFHLNPNSPCINKGTSMVENLPEYDFEGDDRDICSFVDIGADEFVPSACDIIYVKNNGDDLNTGLSWGDALKTLEKAIEIAGDNYQIWVAQGTYTPNALAANSYTEYQDLCKLENKKPTYAQYVAYMNDNTNKTFYVDKPLHIYGGFFGNEVELDDRILGNYITTLSGEMDNDGNPNNNCKRVISFASADPSRIDGFTIKEAGPILNGAGVYVSNTNLETFNCIFTNNHISPMYIQNNSIGSIHNCSFANNINNNVGQSGSCIYIHDSYAQINNSSFSDNISFRGGAINSFSSICKIKHSIFNDNSVSFKGGAIELDDNSSVIVDFSTFSNNTAINSGNTFALGDQDGPQSLKIRNSIIWNTNRVDHIGGTGNIDIKYTDMQLSNTNPNVTYNNDNTNLNEDPEFVSNTNFHLNTTGKYEFLPPIHTWGCSPCIDAGDENEQCYEPNSDRVNMGRYGNTNEAAPPCSKSKKASETDLFISNTIEVNISPNPFSDQLNIIYNGHNGDYVEVSIFNLKGQMVYNKRINQQSDIPTVINWNPKESNTPIPTGIYLVKLQNNQTSSITKVIYSQL